MAYQFGCSSTFVSLTSLNITGGKVVDMAKKKKHQLYAESMHKISISAHEF